MTLRILVLDEGFMSGALAAIGLRDAGCEVDVLAAVGGSSTCSGPRIRWRLGPPPEAPEFDDAIAQIVEARRIDVVYPVTEPLQQRCAAAPDAWRDRVFHCVPERHRALLADKAAMSAAVARHGVPIPRQVPLHTEADLPSAIAGLGLPVVIKGTRGRGGSATRICDDADSARVAFSRLESLATPAIAQEYVAGATMLVGGVFHDGRPVRLYAGIKTMQHPPRTGPAVEIRSHLAKEVIAATLETFAMLRFTGMASADLVNGPAGVRFLEVNPRPWGSIAAANDAGVDCFTPLAAVLRGESPAADLHFAAGVTSRILPLYLLASPYRRRPLPTLRALVNDLRAAQGEPWRSPLQGWHLLRRLQGVGRRWDA